MSKKVKKNVLITGVAGFIGSNLADFLISKGYNVFGVDDLSYGVIEQVPKTVKFFKMDIRDKEIDKIFHDMDFVFHLAAKNSLIDCEKNPEETHDINVNGTFNVFRSALKHNVSKVIYAESSAVYEGDMNLPSTEDRVYPRSIYAKSKMLTNNIANDFQTKGLKTVGLRYFNVYGPRQDYKRTIPPVFSAFIINILKGEQPTIYGDGSKKRDFIYVDDVNDFHLICLMSDQTNNDVFNIGSGSNISINYIFQKIKDILNSDIEPDYGANFDFEAQENLSDISKAKRLGWYPKIDLETGLERSIEYIRSFVV
tara:strand:+ start:33068 stop:34000 length:933 start_codon:yes stop_codon:yes gene_type:complete